MSKVMDWEFKGIILQHLLPQELIMASRVSRAWYSGITGFDLVWEARLERIDRLTKYVQLNTDYSEVKKGEKESYEKWRFLIGKICRASKEDSHLLTRLLPSKAVVKAGGRSIFIGMNNNSSSQVKFLTNREVQATQKERDEAIAKINEAFLRALILYSCDLKKIFLANQYMDYLRAREIHSDDHALFAAALFLKEGSPDFFFSLFPPPNKLSWVQGVEELILISLDNNNCEEALQWVKKYIDSVQQGCLLDEDVLIPFCEKAIDQEKTQLIEDLFLHLFSLSDIMYGLFVERRTQLALVFYNVFQSLRDNRYDIDAIYKKLISKAKEFEL